VGNNEPRNDWKDNKIRKWKWIGHTWRRPSNEITPQALEWNPPGKRNRGRPRNMWRCTVEKELAEIGKKGGCKQDQMARHCWSPMLHMERRGINEQTNCLCRLMKCCLGCSFYSITANYLYLFSLFSFDLWVCL